MDMYSSPEKFGLTMIGEIDWSSGSYEFDLTVVWKRESDGRFVYAEDSGCSCPGYFENSGIEDLMVLRKRGGLNDFKAHCAKRQAESYVYDRTVETVELIERMRAAGAR
jgi:hypothetical protein